MQEAQNTRGLWMKHFLTLHELPSLIWTTDIIYKKSHRRIPQRSPLEINPTCSLIWIILHLKKFSGKHRFWTFDSYHVCVCKLNVQQNVRLLKVTVTFGSDSRPDSINAEWKERLCGRSIIKENINVKAFKVWLLGVVGLTSGRWNMIAWPKCFKQSPLNRS